jgi:transposase InsO family protein
MNTLTQTLKRRQAVIKYSRRYGVSAASRRYNVSRPTIYSWQKRYDGSLSSLRDLSRRPKHHPAQHTEAELKQIQDMRRRNPNAGLVVFWVKLRQHGYTRSISGLLKVLKRTGQAAVKLPNPKYKPKPYEKMLYPGQRGQIDVKYVPASCLVGEAATDGGFYQYTFIDEYSRFRYLEAFREHSTYSSAEFIKHVVKKFPYAIECIQTDNGSEFTNRLNASKRGTPTLFESTLARLHIEHKLIKPYTPRHNGKVERSHRKDNEYFYASHKFYSFDDFCKQLAVWERKYNDFPIRPLNWRSPKDVLSSFPFCKV